jgi:F-type H+-transporting ATPase subunit delta
LQSLADVLDGLPDFDEALRTPRIDSAEKSRLLERVFGSRVAPLTMNFLKVVSSHERLDCLRAIERAAQKLVNDLHNRVEVLVETAAPLSNPLRQSIASRLGQMLGREVVLTTALNPDLLGGLVVRVGDTVYDGSLAGKLQAMQAVALEQTTAKIRESLERFALT